ncbi:MAG: radical SAM protein [Thermoleophilia bacterium]
MIVTRHLQEVELNQENILLINTLSGAIDVIEKDMWRALPAKLNSANGFFGEDEDLIQKLKDRGYLFEDDQEESSTFENMLGTIKKLSSNRAPISIVICPTFNCNFRCQYCYEGLDLRTSKEYLKVADVDRIFGSIDQIVADRQPRGVEIVLFGGEPLLARNRPVVKLILRYCEEKHYPLVIITNGSSISKQQKLKTLLKTHKSIVSKMQITLDGLSDLHDRRRPYANGNGSFLDIVDAIDWLISEEINVAMRVNVDQENIDQVPALTDFIYDKGWAASKHFMAALAPLTDHTNQQPPHILSEDVIVEKIIQMQQKDPRMEEAYLLSMFRVLNHLAQVIGLRPGETSLPMFQFCETNSLSFYVFGADGYIYACPEAIGNHKHAVGRFKPELEIYKKKLNQWDNRNILDIEECRNCSIATFCGGGCAYAALESNGAIDKPVCNRAKEVLETFIDKNKHNIIRAIENNVNA